ncbi:AAA family ATPase [Novosphingobium kunmingense]|uniref:AAA family ATPase n=1 Tax=Novosphingobium kunmingense TaxID=1211806 RepID=UPI0012FD010C|nr:AAA family ATPase [Novosphingobium kunmingense]
MASPAHADAIDWSEGGDALPGLVVHPCENTEAVPVDAARAASLIVLEIDPHNRKSMERLGDLKRRLPDLPVVAALPDASVALVRMLVREGVDDVVSLPFKFEELLETAADVLAQHKHRRQGDQRLAPLFAVVRSIGGCGATSIATHLAAALGERDTSGRGVAIIDLDLQFGAVADYMAAQGRGSVADLLNADERLDGDLVRSVARSSVDNVHVFAAPDAIMPLESVDTDRMLRLIDSIRREYSYVVLELPGAWTNWSLSALTAASSVLMVVELSVSSLRQARRRLDLFSSVGIEGDQVQLVVNRTERRLFKTIDIGDATATLGRPVLGSVSLEDPLVHTAQDQGLMVHHINRKSRFQHDIRVLAETLADRFAAGETA